MAYTATYLKKGLPNCPRGRVFKETADGNYYHFMIDDEALSGKFKDYKFTKQEVLDNPAWFAKPYTK